MRRVSTIIALALCTLLCVVISSAQQTSTTATTASTTTAATASVPNLIRYTGTLTGTLKDAQGAPVSSGTAVGVTFAIYNQQDGGAPVWQETQNVTPDASGNYSALLGSTTATGLPDDLFSQQEQRWLGVQVQGQEEQARVLLVSVPYAFKAHEADTLGGMPASALIQAATSAATSALANGTSVNALSNVGNTAGARGKDGTLPPNGCLEVSGWITYWNANGALCQSNLFQVFNPSNPFFGNIGIGTQNPSTAFDVFGAIDTSPIPKVVPTDSGNYQILENPVLSIGWPSNEAIKNNQNTWVGVYAGGQGTGIPPTNGYDTGTLNTFVGFDACQHNLAGSSNVCVGVNSGFRNANGNNNTTVGVSAGFGPAVQNVNNTTIMGYQAGANNTASNVVFYGYQAGSANTANNNTFVGYTAGTANGSGSSDTFLGNLAGTANVTGSGNTFVGDSAGAANMAGNNNTFTGQNAGKANTASGNSFYGYNSGPVNNTGIQNVFVGWQTGLVNQSGFSNVFMGYQAGQANIDQSYNTYVGTNAGYSVDSSGNTLIGYAAGQNTNSSTGYGITAVGYDAGRANTVGTLNAYFGVNAGFNGVGSPPAVGSYNTYLGNGAGSSANLGAGSNNIFVGFAAGNAENAVNNEIDIGNSGPAIETPNGPNIIIGVQGIQTAAYLAGITPNPPPMLPSVLVDANGRLWQGPAGTGLGGTCNTPGSIAEWLNPMALECSVIYQQATTNYIGIGTLNPSAALDVNGDISAKLDQTSYQIAEETVLQISGTDNLFVGVGAGTASGATSNNTFAGFNAGTANTANGNSFFGYKAGSSNTSGNQNTFVGISAGSDNTTGAGNTYVGFEAGFHGAPGTGTCCNTFLGNGAGLGRTAGGLTGAGNSCTGHRACEAVSSGAGNSAYGYQSGLTTTTGDYNAFYGTYSGANNITGMENTYLGYQADSGSTAGNNNIHVGYQAGSATANGGNNIEIGNVGGSTDAGYIRIGTIGTQVNNTYIAGIAPNPPAGLPTVMVDNFGKLWQGTSSSGGGNVVGPTNPPCTANYLTIWVGGLNVGCSIVWQNPTSPFFVGIGTNNPSTPLEVGGDITADTRYDITSAELPVLSIDNLPINPSDGNLFVGVGAGASNTSGTGINNTYSGYQAGFNASGSYNTYSGYQAGYGNTPRTPNSGEDNTFSGDSAGYFNTTGGGDTFIGVGAGYANTTGGYDTFIGDNAAGGTGNQSGSFNTYTGQMAGYYAAGTFNSFYGQNAGSGQPGLASTNNSFFGANAGLQILGQGNTFLGANTGTLLADTSEYNIFIGNSAGNRNTSASNDDIYIGNAGVASESNTIRIGTQGTNNGQQDATYVAGVFTSVVTMLPGDKVVCVNPAGGIYGAPLNSDCTMSSRRFKENIHDMGDSSSKLFQLRPVTFFYKPQYDDGSHLLQYGLIAEEVAKVYPDLVAYDKDGQPLTVKYQLLAPMLLGELQKEHTVVMAQQDELQTQLQQIKAQRQEIDGLKHELQLQNASLQERLSKLESYVASQTQMKTATDVQPAITASPNGNLQ